MILWYCDVTKEKPVSSTLPPWPLPQLLGFHLLFWDVYFWDLSAAVTYISLVRFPFILGSKSKNSRSRPQGNSLSVAPSVWHSVIVFLTLHLPGCQTWLGNMIKVGYTLSSLGKSLYKRILASYARLCDLVVIVLIPWVGECSYIGRILEERHFKKWKAILFHYSKIAKGRWSESTHERLH